MFSPAEGFGELWFPIQPAKPFALNTAVSMDWCLRVEETICFFSNVYPSRVEVTLKTADALLILEAGLKIKDAGCLTLENSDGIS